MGCFGVLVLGFCGRGGLCFGGSAVLFGFSCGLGFVVAMAWCLVLVFWVWCFGGGGVRVFTVVCVGRVCVCLRVVWWLVCAGALWSCWLVCGGGRKAYTAEPVSMSLALDASRGAQTFFWG